MATVCWWPSFCPAGAERWKNVIADAVLAATGLTKLYERSDASSRGLEGLPEIRGWLRGEGPTDLVLREHDWQLALNIAEGHKTGFYLDQRDSRKKFADYARRLQVSKRAQLLLLYRRVSRGGACRVARACDVDRLVRPGARHGGRQCGAERFCARARHLYGCRCQRLLRQFGAEGRTFDAIVLDPPKFAPTVAHAERAARAYKDINRLAFKLLAARRRVVHLLLLGRHQRRLVSQDCGLGRHVTPGWTVISASAWAARPTIP
jgi:23S rRNA (cytosine1962-C5)-methyltransferase